MSLISVRSSPLFWINVAVILPGSPFFKPLLACRLRNSLKIMSMSLELFNSRASRYLCSRSALPRDIISLVTLTVLGGGIAFSFRSNSIAIWSPNSVPLCSTYNFLSSSGFFSLMSGALLSVTLGLFVFFLFDGGVLAIFFASLSTAFFDLASSFFFLRTAEFAFPLGVVLGSVAGLSPGILPSSLAL